MKTVIHQKDLAQALARDMVVTRIEANQMIQAFLSAIEDHFKKDHVVEIRGFGTFYPHESRPRQYVVPRLGEHRETKGKVSLRFRASKKLQRGLHESL